jgi:GT2 family glycosyltransferase
MALVYPQTPPRVSIILVNFNGIAVILNCLASIQRHLMPGEYEVIVVDNQSTDGSVEAIAQAFPQVQLLLAPRNDGFGAGNNLGAKAAQGEFILLLNSDTEISSNIIPPLLAMINRNAQIGILGPQLRNPDASFQISTSPAISLKGEAAAVKLLRQYERDPESVVQQFSTPQAVDIVVGAAMLIRRSLFESLGGFDEDYFMYFEESDLCQRAREAGWQVWYIPEVQVMHIKGASTQQQASPMRLEYRRSQLLYYQKHRPLWEQLIVRVYLIMKFGLIWRRSHQDIDRQIWQMALGLTKPSSP